MEHNELLSFSVPSGTCLSLRLKSGLHRLRQKKVMDNNNYEVTHEVLTLTTKDKPELCFSPLSSWSIHDLPLCFSICFWIKFIDNFAKLGKYFVDDILQFLQSVWPNLGHVIHNNHRVYSICLLWLIFQDVTKQFCKDSTDRKIRHCSHHEGGKTKMKRTLRVRK